MSNKYKRKPLRHEYYADTQLDFFEPAPSYAAQLMEAFIHDGNYKSLKAADADLKSVKKSFHDKLKDSEISRHEFKEQNIVCKFVRKEIYHTNYKELNKYIQENYGWLSQVAKLDMTSIKKEAELLKKINPFQDPPTFYVKPSLNKVGKERVKFRTTNFDNGDLESLGNVFLRLHTIDKECKLDYEVLKKDMMKCTIVQELIQTDDPKHIKELKKQMSHSYGSVSVIKNTPSYDIVSIEQELGEDFLINYSKPDSSLLEEFIACGHIRESEIAQFKQLVDVNLDFIVMHLDVDQRISSMFHNKRINDSLRRIG